MRTWSRFIRRREPISAATPWVSAFSPKVWKVPTSGERENAVASQEIVGTTGSWMCTTSKSPAASSERSRATADGVPARFDTAPLSGYPIVRPSGTT